ncbi:hypothetical protein [Janthinobacterium agaricidamnosum]|uniref:Putative membrane protein n=1 Tax=Janthinobacterium agaricidamnosum NBRC 102515 = DSM 9628 TaxID=1349767 RepID=W0V484_9BURK|nr:hypothetical protein [Janthinobacterium agaricidamnosum]CDG82691.1 putative membrane protein [Janthinobacterium agaricidamnosum NBRC 102515 = DSM 9628]
MITSHCYALSPLLLCRYGDILLYLAPSLLLALLIRFLSARHPFFFLFSLAGTICHELAHFCVGFLTAAQPRSFTIVPRRVGDGWELGSVMLRRVRWYNAAPAALAPFLILALPFAVAAWRTYPGWTFQLTDIVLAFLVAPQFLACWPSAIDWKIALRSWPYLLIVAAICMLLRQFRPEWLELAHLLPAVRSLLLA